MSLKRLVEGYVESFRGLPREAWLLSLVVLINHAGSMVVFFLPLYLTGDRGFSVMTAGRLISLWGFGSLIGSYAGGGLSRKFRHLHGLVHFDVFIVDGDQPGQRNLGVQPFRPACALVRSGIRRIPGMGGIQAIRQIREDGTAG